MGNINEKTAELIAKLPESLQPIATSLANQTTTLAVDEIYSLIDNLVEGNTEAAYKATLVALDDDALAAEADRVIAELETAAKESAETTANIKLFLKTAATILLSKFAA